MIHEIVMQPGTTGYYRKSATIHVVSAGTIVEDPKTEHCGVVSDHQMVVIGERIAEHIYCTKKIRACLFRVNKKGKVV